MSLDVAPRFIVLTGGPGAGKTAALEVITRNFCEHVAVLPESASIVFGGGFPRRATIPGRRAAQRAIYGIQAQLERLTREEATARVVVCDRGTLDGLAYWPGDADDYFADLGTDAQTELARYALVIHLRTPTLETGYNHVNPLRIETATEASEIDARIERVWRAHPRVVAVRSVGDFVEKLRVVAALVRAELPRECQAHCAREIAFRP